MTDNVQTSGPAPAGGNPLAGLADAQLLAAARAEWPVLPHPFLRWFSDAELVAALRRPEGPQTVAKLWAEREQRLFLASDAEGANPARYGFELAHWKEADAMAREFKFVYVAGGKRASKSERAAKRFVKAALMFPGGDRWVFQGNAKTSIATQQALIWKYLPAPIRALNGKQDKRKVFNIGFSEKNGFTDGVLVLPNRTRIWFMTYEMEVKDYQGWKIGSAWRPGMQLSVMEKRMQELAEEMEGQVENYGWWADEDMSFPWLETCELRSATNDARGIWTFSTTEGITPAIKQVLGTAVTLESRPAELLAGRVNLPGVPAGHMPYRQRAERKNWGAIFFFSEFNPFEPNYANVKEFCEGKTSDVIMENAYGYARDTRNKAFPRFGEVNIIKRENLPAKLTRYMLTDPGDASRNWATIWVAIDERGWHYIYRDWPDEQTYGEWAVPSEDPKQPDGNRGPAQRSLGFGVKQFAETWRLLERRDNELHGAPVEQIMDRYIDPRAAANPHIEEQGGTDLYLQFGDLEDPMSFTGWEAKVIKAGVTATNELLYWDQKLPLSTVNCPRLYVVEDCKQVRWMFSNYTGLGGDKAGAKDFADLVRGMALADLQYFEENLLKSSGGGRGY